MILIIRGGRDVVMQGQKTMCWHLCDLLRYPLVFPNPEFDVNASVQEAERGMRTRSSDPIGKNFWVNTPCNS